MNDTERLDWLESHFGFGLISDDNGHWAVAGDGVQTCPDGPEPQEIDTTFFVEADKWKDSVREAIDEAVDENQTEI